MKISVSRHHITNGVEKDSHFFMIADAIKEAVPDAQYILVDLQSIRFTRRKKQTRYTYLTPPVPQRALLKFDQGDRAISPFTFNLTNPRTRRMGWVGQRAATATRKGKKYKTTGKRLAVVAYKEREFGLGKFTGISV